MLIVHVCAAITDVDLITIYKHISDDLIFPVILRLTVLHQNLQTRSTATPTIVPMATI